MTSPMDTLMRDLVESVERSDLPDAEGAITRGDQLRRRRRVIASAGGVAGAAVLAVGLVVAFGQDGTGSSGSLVTDPPAATSPTPGDPSPVIPDRREVPPGGEQIEVVGADVTEEFTGPGRLELGPVPDGATHVQIEMMCLSAGEFSLANGAGMTCNDPETAGTRDPAPYLIPLVRTIIIGERTEGHWQLTARYVHVELTPWQTNANGETYGVQNENGRPDLVGAEATNGRSGYVRSSDLEEEPPASPEEAKDWNPERRVIEVYESDGVTVIGEFVVGG